MLETMVVMLVLGVMVTFAFSAYVRELPRIRLENATQETGTFLSRARQEAIRASLPVVITVEEERDAPVTAENPNGISQQWLIASLQRPDGTREERFQLLVSRRLGITLRGPLAADRMGERGFTFPGGELTIRQNGTVVDVGAIRISDNRNIGGDAAPRNAFELAYVTRAGKPVVRKWLTSSDSPTGSAGFFEQRFSDGTTEALWEWY
ncbi:MAG: hypothetical protein AAGC60_11710 [Acidobacteriota bacterium]